jgi:hypothetical protein
LSVRSSSLFWGVFLPMPEVRFIVFSFKACQICYQEEAI